jgi:hypothetical protein
MLLSSVYISKQHPEIQLGDIRIAVTDTVEITVDFGSVA